MCLISITDPYTTPRDMKVCKTLDKGAGVHYVTLYRRFTYALGETYTSAIRQVEGEVPFDDIDQQALIDIHDKAAVRFYDKGLHSFNLERFVAMNEVYERHRFKKESHVGFFTMPAGTRVIDGISRLYVSERLVFDSVMTWDEALELANEAVLGRSKEDDSLSTDSLSTYPEEF